MELFQQFDLDLEMLQKLKSSAPGLRLGGAEARLVRGLKDREHRFIISTDMVHSLPKSIIVGYNPRSGLDVEGEFNSLIVVPTDLGDILLPYDEKRRYMCV